MDSFVEGSFIYFDLAQSLGIYLRQDFLKMRTANPGGTYSKNPSHFRPSRLGRCQLGLRL